MEILDGRFGEAHTAQHEAAVTLFLHLRDGNALAKKPATAELIDWVQCLATVFDPSHVSQTLTREAEKLKGPHPTVDWSQLCGLSCLVKLREDLELLGLPTAEAR
jgi:hypothetical protein